MSEKLRGQYEPPGWTGNGINYGGTLPTDPIAADGSFFRGFFNLLLGGRMERLGRR